MILKSLLVIVLILAIGSLGTLVFHGALASLALTEVVVGPYDFVYRTAPNADFGSVRSVTTELKRTLTAAGVHGAKPFDLYPPGGQESEIGFLVSKSDGEQIALLPGAPHYRVIPAQRMITTRMPYRSPFSFIVGYFKVDRALRKYRAEKGYAVSWAATLYEGPTILYLQPVRSLRRD